VVCHGNGPQIGLLALESEADPSLTRPYPLDTLGAETQGMIGYWLAELNGWTMAADGPHWRRVVPSPEPLRLV